MWAQLNAGSTRQKIWRILEPTRHRAGDIGKGIVPFCLGHVCNSA